MEVYVLGSRNWSITRRKGLKIKTESTDIATRIEFADSGPGIPEAKRQQVFEKFYRMETSRSSEGNGLGLSIVKAIVEAHGGTVELSDGQPGLVVSIAFGPGV